MDEGREVANGCSEATASSTAPLALRNSDGADSVSRISWDAASDTESDHATSQRRPATRRVKRNVNRYVNRCTKRTGSRSWKTEFSSQSSQSSTSRLEGMWGSGIGMKKDEGVVPAPLAVAVADDHDREDLHEQRVVTRIKTSLHCYLQKDLTAVDCIKELEGIVALYNAREAR